MTPQTLPQFLKLVKDLSTTYDEFSKQPLEYLSEDTREEHKKLAHLFTRLQYITGNVLRNAQSKFRAGAASYRLSNFFRDLRAELGEESSGDTAGSKLLTKFLKRGPKSVDDTN